MLEPVELPPTVSHGTHNAYANYGCRCEPCREATSAYVTEWRKRNREYQRQYMREYMRKYRAKQREEAAKTPE